MEILTPLSILGVLSIAAVAFVSARISKDYYMEEKKNILMAVASSLSSAAETKEGEDLKAFVSRVSPECARENSVRISVIAKDGEVLFDSDKNAEEMSNHANREEIRKAFEGGTPSFSTRFSKTLRKEMLYLAYPMKKDGEARAVIRASLPVKVLDEKANSLYVAIFAAFICVALINFTLSLYFSYRISSPLKEFSKGIAKFAKGEFGERFDKTGVREIDDLAEILNTTAMNMDRYLREIHDSNSKMNAMLANMREAVIAMDPGERLMSMNDFAVSLFKVNPAWNGKKFYEVIRHPEMQKFCADLIEDGRSIERDIGMYENEQMHLQAKGTILKDADGSKIGYLIVVNDYTRLKKLEMMRSEFVANVSHEIRTPLTVILASVETMLEEKMNDSKKIEKFLRRIAKHAERLNSLVEDILSLSKIEQNSDKRGVARNLESVTEIVLRAAETCRFSADEKGIELKTEVQSGLSASVNPGLIEQALINLIDNAIKYSEKGSPVKVSALMKDGDLILSVKDKGLGIAEDQISRIFERFYRVDKSRSRELGGTGLGLAIVKHIVQAHGGRIEVLSKIGQGSEFIVLIPQNQAQKQKRNQEIPPK